MASSAVGWRGRIVENGVEEAKNTQPFDHWSFLDEIEAPMWADLSCCNLTDEKIEDDWFHISHPFHQCSSCQLVSTVFHSGERWGSNTSYSEQEPPSPKLPPSVSRSRGKNYKTKEWGESRCNATSNKQHPVKNLNTKSSKTAGSFSKAKPISRSGKLDENEGPKACSSCESGLTDTSGSKFSKSHSYSLERREGESSSKSTVTSDHSDHQRKKCSEVSSQTLNQNQISGLLSLLKINLRKSCATRPAARVVVKGGRQSEGGKYSSGKSSTGSSLEQGSFGKKSTLGDTRKKVKTPGSTDAMSISQPPKNKLKVPNVSEVPALGNQHISNRHRKDTLASKLTAKGKVEQYTLRGKVLMMPRKVTEQNQMINKKIGKVCVGRTEFPVDGKETTSGTITTHQKPKSSDKAAKCTGHVQRNPKQGVQPNNGCKKLAELKGKGRDKKSTNAAARKVPFR